MQEISFHDQETLTPNVLQLSALLKLPKLQPITIQSYLIVMSQYTVSITINAKKIFNQDYQSPIKDAIQDYPKILKC